MYHFGEAFIPLSPLREDTLSEEEKNAKFDIAVLEVLQALKKLREQPPILIPAGSRQTTDSNFEGERKKVPA